MRFLLATFATAAAAAAISSAADGPPEFADVFKLLDERCVECHASDDFEGGLVLETYEGILKGGEDGKAVEPGKSNESPLIQWVRDGVEKKGKRKFMPPGKREHLTPEEIQLLARWIDAGAKPGATVVKREIHVPKVAPKVPVRAAVNALAFSPKANVIAAGRYGVVELLDARTREVLRKLEGHAGAVNALVFSPDGETLYAASGENAVTGEVRVWHVADGTLVRRIEGHRDTIYALALSPDGKVLATGSYDQQIKLWDTASGAEMKTLRGHNGAVFALGFRPDGKILASASADRTVKLWDAKTGQRRDTFSQPHKDQYALAWSADGKRLAAAGADNRIRVWEVSEDAKETSNPLLYARYAHEQAVSRLAWTADGRTVASAAQDGTIKLWDATEMKERAVLEKQPDWPSALAFAGDALVAGRIDGSLAAYALADGKPLAAAPGPLVFPASIKGVLAKPGETARYVFDAKAGQTLVFEVAARSIQSKADIVLSLVDGEGRVLASSNDYDSSGDPLIAHTFAQDGRFAVVIGDLQMGGSAEHTYKLEAGAFPFVTACFPLSVPANAESDVELIGYNLPAEHTVKVKAGAPGEMALPLDAAKFRSRRGFKLLVNELAPAREAEPNDQPAQATTVKAPASVGGRIERAGDVDFFRFDARKGSVWAIETQAAQRGSPVDTRIEVLDAQGHKIERAVLQAMRDSAITFRAIDSVSADVRVENWREMGLNQFMYMNGEVAKIFRMPEGPDSGFQYYSNNGKRAAYFGTTAIAHSLDEPCYIVEAHPPGTPLIANGLPAFPVYFENDDDGERELGADSRVLFTAPADGSYLVRVADSRGDSGARNVYGLTIREARPDFSVTLGGGTPTLPARSGQEFTVTANRKDGFEEPITVEITGFPDGFKVTTPLVIESGHTRAEGCIQAMEGTKAPDAAVWANVKVVARGGQLSHDVNGFTKLALGPDPKVRVALEPAAPGDTLEHLSPATPLQAQDPAKPFEITIAPGEIIPAWMKIQRHGHEGDIRFDVENLPHGVIVDNLGLNGITLLPGQNEGEIQLRAEPWVKTMDRLIFAKTRGVGDVTSLPVILHVRPKANASRAVTVK